MNATERAVAGEILARLTVLDLKDMHRAVCPDAGVPQRKADLVASILANERSFDAFLRRRKISFDVLEAFLESKRMRTAAPTKRELAHILLDYVAALSKPEDAPAPLVETKALSMSLSMLLEEGLMGHHGDTLLAAGYSNLSDLVSATEESLTALGIPDYHARVILRCVPGIHQNMRKPPPSKVLRAVSLQKGAKGQSTRRLDVSGIAAEATNAEGGHTPMDPADELPLDSSVSGTLSNSQGARGTQPEPLTLPPVQTNGRVTLVGDPILMSARTNAHFLREYYLGPGEGDGRGFVYVFMSPDMLRVRKAVYKIGSATTGDPATRTCPRVESQRKHYGNVRILDVFPAAFHAFAARLSRAFLDRGEYCRTIDAVRCVNPECQTLHREWYGPALRGGTADRGPHDPYPIIRKVIEFCIASAAEWSPSGTSPFA